MFRRLQSAPPSVWWAWACVAMLGSGAFQLVFPQLRWTLAAGHGLSTLYPALLLAGALAYAGRNVPGWLAPGALLLGIGRGAIEPGGLWFAHVAALLLELGVFLLAAWVMARATRGDASFLQRSLAPALVAIGAFDLVTGATLLRGETLTPGLTAVWLVGLPVLLALQLGAWGQLRRRELERAAQMLEDQVLEQTERYRTVSELSSDYGFSARIGPDRRLEIEWITDAFTRITGYHGERLDGLGWLDLVHPDDRTEVVEQLEGVLGRHRATIEARLLTRSGEVRWIESRFARLDDTPDGRVRLVGAGRDVTERVRAQQEKRRIERRMAETQRMESLGKLAGGIAHDFNNALTVILGNIQLALEEHADGDVDPRRLHRIQAAAEHAAGLTDQILAYSGKAAVALEPLDLSSLVKDILDLVQASVGENAVVDTHLPGGLPPVEGDVTQLRQVLLNLVTNASEALGEQGGLIRVRSGARGLAEDEIEDAVGSQDALPGHYVFLEVADSGPGLDPELRPRIFEPFVSSKTMGRGLGLAAVEGIVRAHRGVILISSDPGHGTVFQVLLPRGSRAAMSQERREVPAHGHGTVLVVDDDSGVREVADAFLSRAGFEVRTVDSGRAALQLLDSDTERVDAVVLDLVMPDLSGEATFLALRERHPELPVVLASGYDRESAAKRFAARGIAGFVRKPFAPDDLARSVQTALARRRRR